MYELVTICFSHYCEKARWALDRAGVSYREAGFMPVLHFPHVAWKLRGSDAGSADVASSRYSTPFLCGPDGLRVSDSREIVRYVDQTHGDGTLFAPKGAEDLDRRYAAKLGPHTRRIVYWFAFARPALLFELADANVSRAQALVFRAFYPAGKRMLTRALSIDEAGYQKSLGRVRQVADEVAERLADGRPYLCGDRFSVADLGFASMMAPAVIPPEYGADLPAPEELSAEAQGVIEEMRAHPAGAFTLRVFRDHRPPIGSASAS